MCHVGGYWIIAYSVWACDAHYLGQDPIDNHYLRQQISDELVGQRLKDIAGQAIVPMQQHKIYTSVPKKAYPYVGRYQTVISCHDPFIQCTTPGSADLIINLLNDGTAHRTIIKMGKIAFSSYAQYRQDYWSYDEKNHQIILQRAIGIKFFYDLDQDGNMMMDLNKIAVGTARNRQYFMEGNPFPEQAYKFTKIY